MGMFKKHCGEVRTWQTQPERWIRLTAASGAETSPETLGCQHSQTQVTTTMVDHIFSSHYEAVGCRPDFNNVVSTIAARDALEPEKFCIREVLGVTLAEVFYHYRDEISYERLYNIWTEGKLLVRARGIRGTDGSAKGLRRQWSRASDGSQWRPDSSPWRVDDSHGRSEPQWHSSKWRAQGSWQSRLQDSHEWRSDGSQWRLEDSEAARWRSDGSQWRSEGSDVVSDFCGCSQCRRGRQGF